MELPNKLHFSLGWTTLFPLWGRESRTCCVALARGKTRRSIAANIIFYRLCNLTWLYYVNFLLFCTLRSYLQISECHHTVCYVLCKACWKFFCSYMKVKKIFAKINVPVLLSNVYWLRACARERGRGWTHAIYRYLSPKTPCALNFGKMSSLKDS